MNREQVRILQANGFTFEGIPNLTPQPRLTYYSRDKVTGIVVRHNLPADPYSLNHYLARGFVLNIGDLKPQVTEESVLPVAQVSEDSVPKRHYRKHKKRKGHSFRARKICNRNPQTKTATVNPVRKDETINPALSKRKRKFTI